MGQWLKTSASAVFLLGFALAGCSSDDPEAPALPEKSHDEHDTDADYPDAALSEDVPLDHYVGEVDDSDVRIAVVSDGTNARLFFCGGPKSVASTSHWFNVQLEGGHAIDRDKVFEVTARLDGDAVSGNFSTGTDGAKKFVAKKIAENTVSGLYEGLSDCGRVALIATQQEPDAQVHTQGACIGPGHVPEQVNPIMPLEFTGDQVSVQAPGGDDTVVLQRAGIRPQT
jgi:hypothetical protein